MGNLTKNDYDNKLKEIGEPLDKEPIRKTWQDVALVVSIVVSLLAIIVSLLSATNISLSIAEKLSKIDTPKIQKFINILNILVSFVFFLFMYFLKLPFDYEIVKKTDFFDLAEENNLTEENEKN